MKIIWGGIMKGYDTRSIEVYLEGKENKEREIKPYIPISLYEKMKDIASSMNIPSRKRISYVAYQALSYVVDSPSAREHLSRLAKSKYSNERMKRVHLKIPEFIINMIWHIAEEKHITLGLNMSKLITLALEIYFANYPSPDDKTRKTDDPDDKERKIEKRTEKKFNQLITAMKQMGLSVCDGTQVSERMFNEFLSSIGANCYNAKRKWKERFERMGFIRITPNHDRACDVIIYPSRLRIPLICKRIKDGKVMRVTLGLLERLKTDTLPYSIPRCLFDEIIREEIGRSPLAYESVLKGMIDEGIIKYLDEKEVIFNVQTS